ncbi:unnamed protein product [Psylliodes chrysocephalus]|uniref:Uncharacterized protein n=1 Tax=Psylliodes chrysocephalus TaxID=3402493 RepID=A0A9P0CH23_9CUCU|nr:unnamed protein product [Psylliodes chrysocephala]
MNKNVRLRFTSNDEIVLLRKVLAQNPFEDPKKCTTIKDNIVNVTNKASLRTLKNHFDVLLLNWLRKDKANINKSGIEETYTEADVLLQELYDLSQVCNRQKISTSSIEDGKAIRELPVTAQIENKENNEVIERDHDYWTMDDDIAAEVEVRQDKSLILDLDVSADIIKVLNTSTPSQTTAVKTDARNTLTRRNILGIYFLFIFKSPYILTLPSCQKKRRTDKPVKGNDLDFLNKKGTADNEIKLRELELEERKLKLEEYRLKLEERKIKIQEDQLQFDFVEKRRKLEMEGEKHQVEVDERKQMHEVIRMQNNLLQNLLLEIKKK